MSVYCLHLYVLTSYTIQHAFSISNHPLILIVSFDGFRYDFLNRGLTPNLLNLQSQGVHSEYMRSIFPTKTYPNHHSIATGLYSEQHGVIDNHIFDPKSNTIIQYSEAMFLKKNIVPIYTLNELQGEGRYSGSMMWPGADYNYQNHSIAYNHLFDRTSSWTSRVDEVISWYLHEDKPANLVMLYFDEPDNDAHMTGADSESVNNQINLCDNITKYLLDQIEKKHLKDHLNIFVLSDHGMASVKVKDIIDLTKVINIEDVEFGGGSPTLEIFPVKDKVDEIYANLSVIAARNKTFQIFRKADMPERWHYKNSERAPPLLALANINLAFQDIFIDFERYKEEDSSFTVTENSTVGLHGYDNIESEMYAMFLAHGPLLKKNTQVPVFDNIDLFSLWCHMLKLSLPTTKGLEQSPGVFSNVKDILADDEQSAGSIIASVLLIVVIIGAVGVILVIYENLGGGMIQFSGVNPVASCNAMSSSSCAESSTQYKPLSQVAEDSEDSDSEGLPRVHLIRESNS